MFVFGLKYLLGLALVGIIWTVRGETSLNSSGSGDNETEGRRHRREESNAGSKILIWGNNIRAQWLSEHNAMRSDSTKHLKHSQPPAAGMMRMYWNAYLEASALAWAHENCHEWRHGQIETVVKHKDFLKGLGKYGSFVGQNIQYYTAPTPLKPKQIMKMYGDETNELIYSGGKASCKPNKACGHFTAITWNTTFLVGCGYARCLNAYGITSVCNFLPGGNGHPTPYHPGPTCSECKKFAKGTFTACKANLCRPKDKCDPVKECKVTDQANCLCDDKEYHRLIKLIIPDIPREEVFKEPVDADSYPKDGAGSAAAVVSGLLLPLVAILLGQGVQLVFDSGLL